MKNFIRNISALSVCAVMLLSGCSSAIESNHAYPEGYVPVQPVTEISITEDTSEFMGNTGDVTLEKGDTYAVIRVKGYGDIKIKLFPEAVPYAVQNFIDLANSGYYDGKTFHRVISDFMIQGASLNGDGTGGTDSNGGEFKCEINTKLRHYYGALCYASAMGSNTCQFYIVNNKTSVNDPALQYQTYGSYYASSAEQYTEMLGQYEEGSYEYDLIQQYIRYYNDSVAGIGAMYNTTDETVKAKYAAQGGVPFLDGGYVVFGQTVEGFDVIDKISAVEVSSNAAGEASSPVKEITIEKVVIRIVD